MGTVKRFSNCLILRDGQFVHDDLWVQDGKFIDPRDQFFAVQQKADECIDCNQARIVPGFIDIQINGAFGVDFTSMPIEDIPAGLAKVRRALLAHGVTAFCPTIITSTAEHYKNRLKQFPRLAGDLNGAAVLGVHLEGPFINPQKKGAHPEECILTFPNGIRDLEAVYGDLDNVALVTLAPELEGTSDVIHALRQRGIQVSIGHTKGNLDQAEKAIYAGATCITHLFNAMTSFHHRDPGILGLLPYGGEKRYPLYYGLIVDGFHTHDASIRLAYAMHPAGCILVTDATEAMGLEPGEHTLGEYTVVLDNQQRLTVKGTDTLAGSAATMDACVRRFASYTGLVAAAMAASQHPAEMLGAETKGKLLPGYEADFVLLNDDMHVSATFIGGECVYQASVPKQLARQDEHVCSVEVN